MEGKGRRIKIILIILQTDLTNMKARTLSMGKQAVDSALTRAAAEGPNNGLPKVPLRDHWEICILSNKK